jgi:hypothetical protein
MALLAMANNGFGARVHRRRLEMRLPPLSTRESVLEVSDCLGEQAELAELGILAKLV